MAIMARPAPGSGMENTPRSTRPVAVTTGFALDAPPAAPNTCRAAAAPACGCALSPIALGAPAVRGAIASHVKCASPTPSAATSTSSSKSIHASYFIQCIKFFF